MNNEIKKVYDIRVEGDILAVDLYEHTLKRTLTNGKPTTYNCFKPITTVYPEDIKSYIKYLLDNHYFSRLDFHSGMNEEVTKNPFLKLKLMLLSNSHKILQMIYNPYSVVNNLNVITTSISYINMFTGEINEMSLDNLGLVTSSKINNLEAQGFINIDNAYQENKNIFKTR